MEESTPSFLDKVKSLSFGQMISIGALLILVIALPVGIILSLNPVKPRPGAQAPVTPPGPVTGAATLTIIPSTFSTTPTSVFSMAIEMETAGYSVTGADVTLNYDINKFKVLEVLPGPFLPVTLEEPEINSNQDNGQTKTRFVVGSRENAPSTGKGTIAIVKFKAADIETEGELFVNTELSKISAVGNYDNILGNVNSAYIKIRDDSNSTLQIKVSFEGLVAKARSEKITYTLKNQTDNLSGILPVTSTSLESILSGTISGVVPGTYKLLIKGPVHLSKNYGDIILTPGENTEDLSYFSLLAGDTDGNNKIDIFDYNDIVADFGSKMPQSGSVADLDFDGDVDIFDYNIFVGNYGKSGETL